MIHVFDTSSLHALQHFYPSIFKSIWGDLNALADKGELISTREVFNELVPEGVGAEALKWGKDHKPLFTTPTNIELQFVAEIFKVKHFQALIGTRQRLKGMPVADPFVIACARIHSATVVTEEGWQHGVRPPTPKPNAAKIPNVCAHFHIPCINLEEFMHRQGWTF